MAETTKEVTVLEYATRDKSEWGYGAWQEEPDKVQWVDAATGLDCLIVRGPAGALCGYVGVPESHPMYGKDYGQCALATPCEDSYCDHSPGSRLSVHGGVTFADSCHEATREAWGRWRESMLARRGEAAKYPRGDSARAWKERGHLVDDYEAWALHMEQSSICHRPLDGRPDTVWWFGFDCAHSGDYCPAFDHDRSYRVSEYSTYKDRGYVEAECRDLAGQLAALAAVSSLTGGEE